MDNKFWCLVHYIGVNPAYYRGVYRDGNPSLTAGINFALKLRTKGEADTLLEWFPEEDRSGFVVEEHSLNLNACYDWNLV